MNELNHWVIIRYNLGLYGVRKDTRKRKFTPDEWMENRLPLYQNYTLKSLENQTNKDFTLALLFDKNTPRKTVNKIANLSSINTRTYLIDYPSDAKYQESMLNTFDFAEIAKDIAQTKTSLQTRLDNDDALFPDAIRSIQSMVRHEKKYSIDSLNGLVIDIQNKQAYYATHRHGSPFISLYQSGVKRVNFIYETEHHKIGYNIRNINIVAPLWAMIIHGANISNRVFPWMIQKKIDYDEALRIIKCLK